MPTGTWTTTSVPFRHEHRASGGRGERPPAAGALDSCREPLLVAGPDDGIEYANGQLASAVAIPRPALRGREWTTLFTDAAIDRLRRQAIPVASEGWHWSGTATLSADDDTTRPVRTHLVGPEDGSTVVVLRGFEPDAEA